MFYLFYSILGVLLCPVVQAQEFEGLAYGFRTFHISARDFSTFVPEGNAILQSAPTKGTVKQLGCVDDFNFGDIAIFENAELSICYEGGPQIVSGATDNFTFTIVGLRGQTATVTVLVTGSDPVLPFPPEDRLLENVMDSTTSFFINSTFAFLREDALALTEFEVMVTNVAFDELGTLTNSLGNVITEGSVLSSNDTVTFTPFPGIFNCVPFSDFFLSPDCSEVFSENNFERLTFSIIFGEGDDEFIREPFSVLLIVSQGNIGDIVIQNRTTIIPVEDAADCSVIVPYNTNLFSFVSDDRDSDLFLKVSIEPLSGLGMSPLQGSASGARSTSFINCNSPTKCRIVLIGTAEGINEAIDQGFSLLNFDPYDVRRAVLQITVNDGEKVETLSFEPLGTAPFELKCFLPSKVSMITTGTFILIALVVILIIYVKRRKKNQEEAAVVQDMEQDVATLKVAKHINHD